MFGLLVCLSEVLQQFLSLLRVLDEAEILFLQLREQLQQLRGTREVEPTLLVGDLDEGGSPPAASLLFLLAVCGDLNRSPRPLVRSFYLILPLLKVKIKCIKEWYYPPISLVEETFSTITIN